MLVHPKPRHVLLGWRSSLWQWAGGRGVLTGAGICESAYPTGTQARCKGSLQWHWSWRCSGGRGQHNQSTKTVNPASPRGWDKADIIKGSHTISFLPSSESCSKVSTQHQQGTKAGRSMGICLPALGSSTGGLRGAVHSAAEGNRCALNS